MSKRLPVYRKWLFFWRVLCRLLENLISGKVPGPVSYLFLSTVLGGESGRGRRFCCDLRAFDLVSPTSDGVARISSTNLCPRLFSSDLDLCLLIR
ncbi:hypothetical protein EV421DRAFT_586283 [Armillaria borealis]|uniref:Secreted protein n=1 Tax=Armillaria borealis TaxID=47425 RepID=A0AA39JHU3_9AGAR|nr:hypothetical protein EV421DRAFT_586283 [Armillaria borealis]